MKKFFATLLFSVVVISVYADRPVTVERLPAAAREFIVSNYPSDNISYAIVDDDIVRPDYTVVLVSGARIEFNNHGALKSIEDRRNGISRSLLPVQIADYVNRHYPDASFIKYEIDRRGYDVTLSNRLELKFNRHYNVVEVDD